MRLAPNNLSGFPRCSTNPPPPGQWLVVYERGPMNGKGRLVPSWYVEAELEDDDILSDFIEDPTEAQPDGGYLYEQSLVNHSERILTLTFVDYRNWGEE